MFFNRKLAPESVSSVPVGKISTSAGEQGFATLESRGAMAARDLGWVLVCCINHALKIELGTVDSTEEAIQLLAASGFSYLSEH